MRDAVPSRPIVQDGVGPASISSPATVVAVPTADRQNPDAAQPARSILKRGLDLFGSLFLLLLLAPAFLCIAVAVRLDSPGPALFRQKRTGLGGRPFTVFKFRTMAASEEDNTAPAQVNDPRVTRLGALLRRSSIDELPQLLNVVRGEMSLVGPRPHALDHDQKFAREIDGYDLRFCARPGITGLAQISGSRGGGDVFEMRRRLVLDRRYIECWSIWADIRILFLTIPHLLLYRAH